MSDDYTRLGRALRDLEKRDPAIKAARERIDHVTSEHERWRRAMVRDLWAETRA